MQNSLLQKIKSAFSQSEKSDNPRTTKAVVVCVLAFVLFLVFQIDSGENLPADASMQIGTVSAQAKDTDTLVMTDAANLQIATATIPEDFAAQNEEDESFFSFFTSIFSEEDDENDLLMPDPIIIEKAEPKIKMPTISFVESKVFNSYYELSGFVLENDEKVLYGEVKKGDTLSTLLNSWVLNAQINEAIKIAKPMLNLSNIQLGNPYAIVLDSQNRFKRFEYEVSSEMIFTLFGEAQGEPTEQVNEQGEYSNYAFTSDYVPIDFEIELALIKGEIKYSLFDAVVDANAGASLVNKMVDVFAYQIDFFRDIREGDSFEVLVEKKYKNGKFYGYGDALAMVFVNQGTKHVAYQHKIDGKGSGYYDENGDALERLLLRSPLNYSRISSGYSMARRHPILDITRPHQGIDYAAPYGTPVRTVGDGTVIYVGWKGDYGNTVIVSHSNGLETQYAHLSKFSSGIKKGSKVSKGETIAFVGSTGLSTGPHLDFRLRKNGKFVNPQSIIIPNSPPLEGGNKDAFLANLQVIHAYLDGSKALAGYIEE